MRFRESPTAALRAPRHETHRRRLSSFAIMLVDYSDSDDDETEPAPKPATAPAAPLAPAAPPPAPLLPPAKKAKKQIDLASLLRKHDAELPFEEASKLPADFFDSAAPQREIDAGEADAQPPARGWAALSAMLPAPKNQAKPGKSAAASLYARAQPLKKSGGAGGASSSSAAAAAVAGPSCGPAAAVSTATTAAAAASGAASSSSSLVAAADVDDDEEEDAGSVAPAAASLLLPRLRVGMYDTVAPPQPPQPPAPHLTYDVAAGPTMGPTPPAADDGMSMGAYDEVAPYDMDDGNVVSVSQDSLRKAMGAQKQCARRRADPTHPPACLTFQPSPHTQPLWEFELRREKTAPAIPRASRATCAPHPAPPPSLAPGTTLQCLRQRTMSRSQRRFGTARREVWSSSTRPTRSRNASTRSTRSQPTRWRGARRSPRGAQRA